MRVLAHGSVHFVCEFVRAVDRIVFERFTNPAQGFCAGIHVGGALLGDSITEWAAKAIFILAHLEWKGYDISWYTLLS